MIKTFLNAHVNAKIAAGLIAVAAAGGVGMKVKESHATTTALTGQCGMLFSSSFAGMDAKLANGGSVTVGTNFLVLMDFTAGTLDMQKVNIQNYGNTATATAAAQHATLTFTQAAGPVAGSYQLTLNDGSSSIVNILPVNSGNTFLVQYVGSGGGSVPGNGVCQKV